MSLQNRSALLSPPSVTSVARFLRPLLPGASGYGRKFFLLYLMGALESLQDGWVKGGSGILISAPDISSAVTRSENQIGNCLATRVPDESADKKRFLSYVCQYYNMLLSQQEVQGPWRSA